MSVQALFKYLDKIMRLDTSLMLLLESHVTFEVQSYYKEQQCILLADVLSCLRVKLPLFTDCCARMRSFVAEILCLLLQYTRNEQCHIRSLH